MILTSWTSRKQGRLTSRDKGGHIENIQTIQGIMVN